MDVSKELQVNGILIRPIPEKTVVAMAYVPYQNARKLYSPEQGICTGTMFPELNKPFDPEGKKGGTDND